MEKIVAQTLAAFQMTVDTPYKPMTAWQWLEQDLTLFVLYCRCDGQPRMIANKWEGLKHHCVICGADYKPRKEAGL